MTPPWTALTSTLCMLGVAAAGWTAPRRADVRAFDQAAPAAAAAPSPEALDKLLAPVALYPDQLLAQMLLCAQTAPKVQELSGWLIRNPELKGTALQDAVQKAGFEPSFVVLALFPQVVNFMADDIAWTRQVGAAFTANRQAVLDSVQRLRAQCQEAGNLKSTAQQKVETEQTSTGQQVIVIEPANPQVVYVPQYNPQVVYTQPSTVVVHEESNSTGAAVAGAAVGFAAGIAIGAAMDNDYYYGPYGWGGGPRMYNDAWNDYYDDRQDAREDYYEHREDAREDYYENREDARENAGDRSKTAQQERTNRQQTRQDTASGTRSGTSTAASTTRATPTTQSRTGAASAEARGTTTRQPSGDRSGTRSDAFSGYSSGKSERSASTRGASSRSRSGGGGRSGGRRR